MSSIKVTRDNVTRKIHVEETSSWEDVAQRISEVFKLDAKFLMLTYEDCDNDVITLSTITELWEAIREGVKKFDLSAEQAPSMLDTTIEMTMTTEYDKDMDSEDEKIADVVRRTVSAREPDYYTDSGKRAINIERGAPGTLKKRKSVESYWLAFLESHGLERTWDPEGPSIEMCAAFMHFIAETSVGKNDEVISAVWFYSVFETFLHLVSKYFAYSHYATSQQKEPFTKCTIFFVD
jgi:hypothetical protein